MAPDVAPYAAARVVTDPADCFFYHSMDIPGHGEVVGQWDLRPNVDAYLGGVDLRGKRVLEVGTASGFLCLHMERQGADIVACDLSEQHAWDVVPFADHEFRQSGGASRDMIRRLNNAYWLAHRASRSRAQVVYTPAHAIPEAIGPVDVTTFYSILLHLRDPFAALSAGLRLTRDRVIVTDMLEAPDRSPLSLFAKGRRQSPPRRIVNRLRRMLARALGVVAKAFGSKPEQIERLVQHVRDGEHLSQYAQAAMTFLPDHRLGAPRDTWWTLSPEVICRFLGVLGFEETTVTYHNSYASSTADRRRCSRSSAAALPARLCARPPEH
jgi:hypothetical protein